MATALYWYEQGSDDVPPGVEWLAAGEVAHLRRLRIPKRIADWRLGRWTAKRALAHRMEMPCGPEVLAQIEIVPAQSGAPVVSVSWANAGWNISITHCGGHGACALVNAGDLVGCDLERIEERDPAFLDDYFCRSEQQVLNAAAPSDRPLLATLYWSAKESALKVLQEGLRLDTRSVSVTRVDAPAPWSLWSALEVWVHEDVVLHGWWRADQHFVRTVLCSSPTNPPQLGKLFAPDWYRTSRGPHASAIAYATAD